MRSEWEEVRLGNITTKIGSGATPRGGSQVYSDAGVTFIRSQNVLNYDFNIDGLVFVNDEHAKQLENVAVHENDILLNITGDSVARACLAPTDMLPARVNQHVSIIRVNPSIADHKYILYQLQNLKDLLLSYSHSGATRKALTKSMLENLKITLPTLPEQKAISDILACLDAKIELNNKMNENLEAQAEAIFKSWFVDFEPFQDGEFVESELGLIPEGWHVKPLSVIVASTIAGDWGKAEPEGNHTAKVYCIRGADIPDVQWGNKGKMPTRYTLPKNIESKRLQSGNLVVEISGGSPTQSTGRVVKISDYLLGRYDADMICTNFCRALSVEPPYSTFLYRYWLHMYDLCIMFGYENGTTGIKNFDLPSFLKNTLIALPPNEVLEEYNGAMDVFEARVYGNGLESEVLSTLRDTLLPKLMSGEIEVPVD